ncbi:hypothetical protein [Fodinicurvata halophila]|uniref:hypothetical protein n=1 Tax=Fodinicurvata halophila TaxID=1419723 RepID=UPI00363A2390
MHALKALVIGMGILIIIGMGLVIWGFARQATQLAEKSENGPSAESPFSRPASTCRRGANWTV